MRRLSCIAALLSACDRGAEPGAAAPSCETLARPTGSAPGDWERVAPGLAGADTMVSAIAVASDRVYVTGHFQYADGAPANNVAVWDGVSWALPPFGVYEWGAAIAADGAGTIWATAFPGDRVLRFDGEWSELGASTFGPRLVAVAPGVAAYGAGGIGIHDGASWQMIDERPVAAAVTAGAGVCVVGDDAPRCWDGAGWSPLGEGLGAAEELARAEDGTWFAATADLVVALDTSGAWRPLADRGSRRDLAIVDGEVVMTAVGGGRLDRLLPDGTWMPLADGVAGYVGLPPETAGTIAALAPYRDRIVAAGIFCEIDGVVAASVASIGLDGTVEPLTALY